MTDPDLHGGPFGPGSITRYRVHGVDFDTVRVPPGRFVDGEGASKRALLVSRPFELGVTPVTQALWRAVMGTSPSSFEGDDRPVEQVSWNEVQQLMAALASRGFPGFRLPTEAEWAWAARCGVPTRWAGADRVGAVAVVDQHQTALVGGLLPSAVGALDLSGSLWEWQQDQWAEVPAGGVDVQGPASGSFCVVRGGIWYYLPQGARVALRGNIALGDRYSHLGVRLLRAAP